MHSSLVYWKKNYRFYTSLGVKRTQQQQQTKKAKNTKNTIVVIHSRRETNETSERVGTKEDRSEETAKKEMERIF